MAALDSSLVLDKVPAIRNLEYPDIFADALGVALCYGDDSAYEAPTLLRPYALTRGHRDGVYGAISAVTGRGWLIGFDDACYYPEKGDPAQPAAGFAVAGLDAALAHQDTMWQAISLLDRVPEPLWNDQCEVAAGGAQAAGLLTKATRVDGGTLRRYMVDYLAQQRRPLIALLHLPQVPIVEFALLTGYEQGGDTILGRSPYLGAPEDSGPDGYFRMGEWEPRVVAVVGITEEREAEVTAQALGHLAIENALRLSRAHSEGSRHYGLAAYDAWERALLDDAAIDGVSDDLVAQGLQHHSITAGFIACQKAFCVMPQFQAPAMGVITGLARRAAAGPGLVHGLMWDAWHAVGAYWRSAKPADGDRRALWNGTDELRRFRDHAVRERAAAVVRRARQVDAQSLEDLATAKEEWDTCRGHGGDHPCPCWDAACLRVWPARP